MLERMAHQSWYARESWTCPDGAVGLGRVSLGFVNTTPQPVTVGGRTAVLDGELSDYAVRRRALEAGGCRFQGESHAELLLHGLVVEGTGFLRSLSGSFSAAIWDADAETLQLVGDRFGIRPLYYTHGPGRLEFASELKSLLADPVVSRATDPRGLAQFFTFGHYLGTDTGYAAVTLLPAAGILTYHAASDRLDVETYARLGESWRSGRGSTAEHLERIDAAFHRAVARCCEGTAALGLSLSGGLDARTILGVVAPDRELTTLCLGMDGSIDVNCARELARLTNRPHHTHTLDTRFLARFEHHMRDMVHLTDGQYLCQCIVLPTLPLYRELGIEVLLRGHAGELMHMTKAYNFSLDRDALALTDAGVEDWLWRRLQAHMLDGVAGNLFTPAFGSDLAGLARDSLRDSLRESDGIGPPAHRIWHAFLAQRVRRETALSMVEFGSVVETRLPYLDTDLIDALMAAPPELKLDETIQTAILRKRQPSFLSVVNANTGARMDAGPLTKKLGKLRLKVLSKLGVKGYQPYERLGLWLRRELRPLVEHLLLDERCLGRGVFEPDAVRSVVANHLANRRNHTYLVLAMMIFELSQREFVDGDAYTEGRVALAQ
jgi:asparagine synthase (glutamine-hydrolysing)